jgi:phosphoribosylformylglycinamidine (FGAM) synthase-like enzyme
VRTNTVIGPGGDAAALRIRGTSKALAVATDCNGRYCYLDPRMGARIAVAEAARNVACTGGRPLAITNNLNFGNPRKPEVYYQLREAIRGMAEACDALGTRVTGGNVTLYNESPSGAVYPTPVIGMVGVIDAIDHVTRAAFERDGDAIVLLGEPTDELGGSEYLHVIHGVVAGAPPSCDLTKERALIDALLEAISLEAVRSAHDCSDGGLAVALAECAMMNRARMMGADVDLSTWSTLPLRALLFGEAQSRVIVSTADSAAVLAAAKRHGVRALQIGWVRASGSLRIKVASRIMEAPLSALANAYHEAIPSRMARSAAPIEVAFTAATPA